MKENKLYAFTLPLSEGGTFPVGEGDTTEALGEEHPTSPDAEGPAAFAGSEQSKRGGPFGAY